MSIRHIKTPIVRVGLIGYGRAGQAVARVLQADPTFELAWIARQSAPYGQRVEVAGAHIPLIGLQETALGAYLHKHPVDALVDFSVPDAVYAYGEEVRQHGLTLVSAISAYSEKHLTYLKQLGTCARVLASPNITLGINFLMLAAKWLRQIAPFADVEILEQHFKQKPEVSGTARKLADTLGVGEQNLTSMRLGGIVGHHEVIFGFPYQTVRLIHDSIGREAFGTGAVFALNELQKHPHGFYGFEDLLQKYISTHNAGL